MIADKLRNAKRRKRAGPVWKGPEVDGVTQSLLGRFLACRERFRLLVVEGLKPQEGWNHKLGYGNMWHVCEEAFAIFDSGDGDYKVGSPDVWEPALKVHCQEQCKLFPAQQQLIQLWYGICRTQFPLYVAHWAKHPDVQARTPLLSEQVFDVPYKLPSGRTVRLRGKWDSVDLVRNGGKPGTKSQPTQEVWLQENKTKSRIDERLLRRQLSFDLQTMTYLVALERAQESNDYPLPLADIKGVRYNVVRRTEHRQGKKESLDGFLDRLKGMMEESPDEWFMRWNVLVSQGEVHRFRRECLDPVLEQLCDWWDYISNTNDPFAARHEGEGVSPHYRFPFGVYNPTAEGVPSEMDELLASGSEAGLERVDDLFPELKE